MYREWFKHASIKIISRRLSFQKSFIVKEPNWDRIKVTRDKEYVLNFAYIDQFNDANYICEKHEILAEKEREIRRVFSLLLLLMMWIRVYWPFVQSHCRPVVTQVHMHTHTHTHSCASDRSLLCSLLLLIYFPSCISLSFYSFCVCAMHLLFLRRVVFILFMNSDDLESRQEPRAHVYIHKHTQRIAHAKFVAIRRERKVLRLLTIQKGKIIEN